MTNKTNAIKNIVGCTALASSIALNAISADMTPHGRVEMMVADQKSSLEIKASMPLNEKFSLFGKSVTTHTYSSDKTSPFAFIDLNYSLGKGVSAVYETQFIDLNDGTLIQPRLGISYFKPIVKDLNFFTACTLNLTQNRDPDTNLENVTTLSYRPKLSKDSSYNLVSQAELVTNLGDNGLNFASQKLRLGIGKGNLECGLAIDFKETKSDSSHTIGGFVAYKF